VSVSKLRALVIQFLLPVLVLGLAALPKPGAPLRQTSAPIAKNLKVNGLNPLDPTKSSACTSRDT
jgi:hypothetical protein